MGIKSASGLLEALPLIYPAYLLANSGDITTFNEEMSKNAK